MFLWSILIIFGQIRPVFLGFGYLKKEEDSAGYSFSSLSILISVTSACLANADAFTSGFMPAMCEVPRENGADNRAR